MTSPVNRPAQSPGGRGPLESAIIALAGTPQHSAGLDQRYRTIVKLAVERVAAARYASVTALRDRAYVTVAVNDDLIRSVEEAQHADNAGPCLDALAASAPVGVTDIDKTVQWPGFQEAAPRMGLHASVSVPLFAGPGEAVATLNIYSHDRAAMAPLIFAICSVHQRPSREADEESALLALDAGGRELVTGYAEARNIRAAIQLAIELIKRDNRCGADDAYLSLCIKAAEAGTDLGEAAAAVISGR
ncbi:MAG TPA: GAF domain-containing protein [Actinoplanes sp.]